MSVNKIRVEVFGTEYIIATTDNEKYVQSLAEKLDADMHSIMEHTPSASMIAAAITAALGYLDDATKANESVDNMREQIKDYLQESAQAKAATQETQREIERLRREVGYLSAAKPQRNQ